MANKGPNAKINTNKIQDKPNHAFMDRFLSFSGSQLLLADSCSTLLSLPLSIIAMPIKLNPPCKKAKLAAPEKSSSIRVS